MNNKNNDVLDSFIMWRFKNNWLLRNILFNYFVYWRDTRTQDSKENIDGLRRFLTSYDNMNKEEYHGIERILSIEKLLLPTGLPNPDHIDLLRRLVNEEYGIDRQLTPQEKNKPYLVSDFFWRVSHPKDFKIDPEVHMLEIVKGLFEQIFGGAISVTVHKIDNHTYLVLQWDNNNYTWPIMFKAGTRTLNDRHIVYSMFGTWREQGWDPEHEFPTICGLYFGDDIRIPAQQLDIKLVQLSSLFKLLQWVEKLKKEKKHTVNEVMEHFNLMLIDQQTPIAVGLGISRIESKLATK